MTNIYHWMIEFATFQPGNSFILLAGSHGMSWESIYRYGRNCHEKDFMLGNCSKTKACYVHLFPVHNLRTSPNMCGYNGLLVSATGTTWFDRDTCLQIDMLTKNHIQRPQPWKLQRRNCVLENSKLFCVWNLDLLKHLKTGWKSQCPIPPHWPTPAEPAVHLVVKTQVAVVVRWSPDPWALLVLPRPGGHQFLLSALHVSKKSFQSIQRKCMYFIYIYIYGYIKMYIYIYILMYVYIYIYI